MKIFGDYHTHTTFSHGKGTVLENAIAAKQKGLKQLAIADHGFGHILYGIKRDQMAKLKAEIVEAEKQTGVKIFLGVEANFVAPDGTIDLSEDEIKMFDIILVGQHRFVKSKFVDKFRFFLPNILGVKSQKQIERNTQAVCLAMAKYPIDIFVHPKHGMALDMLTVAKKAVETNTLIELNASKMLFSKQEIAEMVALGVKFVVDSDAHCPENVGNAGNILEIVEKYQIPAANVVNLNGVPKFKRVEGQK